MPTCQIQLLTHANIIGESKGLRQAVDLCHKIAKESEPVMFQGEIGTGKLLLASYMHLESSRSNNPFLVVDCTESGGIIRELCSPEFKMDEFKNISGGSLYFREVTSLKLEEQALLFENIKKLESLDIRLFIGSSQNIHFLMVDKAFNQEMYRYFSASQIEMPSLRQRKEDILPIAHYFMNNINLKLRKSIQGFTPRAEQILLSYKWPGNVEELQQLLIRTIILANESHITQRNLNEILISSGNEETSSLEVMPLERMEEILIKSALERYGSTLDGKKKAAKTLNISLATLYNKIKRYNLG